MLTPKDLYKKSQQIMQLLDPLPMNLERYDNWQAVTKMADFELAMYSASLRLWASTWKLRR
jgi:hypothetical protein